MEEPARVGRDRFEVAALSFGVDGAEGERRFAGPRHPGEHDQCVTRDVDVYVAEVVLAGAAHPDHTVSSETCSQSLSFQRLGCWIWGPDQRAAQTAGGILPSQSAKYRAAGFRAMFNRHRLRAKVFAPPKENVGHKRYSRLRSYSGNSDESICMKGRSLGWPCTPLVAKCRLMRWSAA